MAKKVFVLVAVMAVCGATLFAQGTDTSEDDNAKKKKSLFSAGAYGDFMGLSGSYEVSGYKYKTSIVGGGFGLFFDASYAEIGLGLDFANESDPDESDDKGIDLTYFSISLLGKYPIVLNEKLTLFPMLGFDWNIFTEGKGKESGHKIKRSDLDSKYEDSYDAFLIDFGVGADFALSDALYLRGSALYGIKLNSKQEQESVDDHDAKIFTGGVTLKVGVGYKL